MNSFNLADFLIWCSLKFDLQVSIMLEELLLLGIV